MTDRIAARKRFTLAQLHYALAGQAVVLVTTLLALAWGAWLRADHVGSGDEWRTLYRECQRHHGCHSVNTSATYEWVTYSQVMAMVSLSMDITMCLTVSVTYSLAMWGDRFYSWPYCAGAILVLLSSFAKTLTVLAFGIYHPTYKFPGGGRPHLAEGYWLQLAAMICSAGLFAYLVWLHRYVYTRIVAPRIKRLDEEDTMFDEMTGDEELIT